MGPLQRVTAPTVDALRVLLDSDSPIWGLRIAKLIGRPAGTVYPMLTRLEEAGWLSAEWEADSDREGPRRRLYRLTAHGASEAAQVIATFDARQPRPVARPAMNLGRA